jgi:hypothetical protein
MFAAFCDLAAAKAWQYANWPRAFQGYVRNAAPKSGHFSAGNYPLARAVGSTGETKWY